VRARRLNAGVVLNDEKVLRRQAEGAMDEMDAWACEGLADPSLLQLAARVFALCTLYSSAFIHLAIVHSRLHRCCEARAFCPLHPQSVSRLSVVAGTARLV
jgi:hypothetical protein